jgi:hypothetical protein
MDNKNGFPPGYEFRKKQSNPDSLANEKRQQAYQDFSSSPLTRGIPLQYDSNGLPIVEPQPNDFNPPPTEEINARLQYQQPVQQPQFQPQFQPQQPRQQPPMQSRPIQKSQKYVHPVISRMMEKFGLKNSKRHVLTVWNGETDIHFTMTIVPEEISIWALGESQRKMTLDKESDNILVTWFELLNTCCSIIAIDNTPVYELFSIILTKEEKLEIEEDKLFVSNRVRKISGQVLADMFWKEILPMGDKLLDFYSKTIVSEINIKSGSKESFRFICPIDECSETQVLPINMVNGEEKPYFCKVHGVELVKVASRESESNFPLA